MIATCVRFGGMSPAIIAVRYGSSILPSRTTRTSERWARESPIALLNAATAFAGSALSSSTNEKAGGSDEVRNVPGTTPDRHLGYAVQWFAFAALAAAIWFVVSFRKTGESA